MLKGFFIGIVATLIAALIAIYLVVTQGVIPAGADVGPLPLEHWVARSSLHATLESQAPRRPDPVPLTDANLIAGIQLYAQHCAICHGTAQGDASASPVAKGEYPAPPQLATDGVEDDPEGVTFWKLDHGIRWTGMPSWKKTLTARQMWTLALFLKHMDKLSPAAEQAWQAVTNSGPPQGAGAAQGPGAAQGAGAPPGTAAPQGSSGDTKATGSAKAAGT